jgi:hypothetical protein
MRASILILLLAAGCTQSIGTLEGSDPYEGDGASECDDGRDNDADGLTDCEDDGCDNAGPCRGGDDDDAVDDDDSADDDDDATPAVPTAFLYAHTATGLYTIEPVPPYGETFVGGFGFLTPSITDIGIDLHGVMWGVGFYETYAIDALTGSTNQLGTHGSETNAMTVLSDGTILAGGGSTLFTMSPSTGALAYEMDLSPWVFAGDMVGVPGGLLYCLMAEDTPSGPTSLVVVDLSTGSVNEVGPTGVGAMYGVAYHAQTDLIFGFAASGAIYTLDPATGIATLVRTSSLEWWGATTNPARWSG